MMPYIRTKQNVNLFFGYFCLNSTNYRNIFNLEYFQNAVIFFPIISDFNGKLPSLQLERQLNFRSIVLLIYQVLMSHLLL